MSTSRPADEFVREPHGIRLQMFKIFCTGIFLLCVTHPYFSFFLKTLLQLVVGIAFLETVLPNKPTSVQNA